MRLDSGSDVVLSFNKNETPKEVALRFLVAHRLPSELTACIERFVTRTNRTDRRRTGK